MGNNSKIRVAATHMVHELRLREASLRNTYVIRVARLMLDVIRGTDFAGIWTKKYTSAFFGRMGCSGLSVRSEKELFQITVTLVYLLRSLSGTSALKIRHWPHVELMARQYLAIEYDADDFERLPDYHRLVRQLLQRSANFGINQKELCARLILSMIALDGVIFNNADGQIASLEKDMVHLEPDLACIELPMIGEYQKQYFLGGYSLACMRILYQRAKNKGPIFPKVWQVIKRGEKGSNRKRSRSIDLEGFLAELWRSAIPNRPVPDDLDAPFWIRLSRLSLAVSGVPFVCVAHLGSRFRGAQLPVAEVDDAAEAKSRTVELDGDMDEVDQGFQWLRSLHGLFRIHDSSQHDKPILKEAHAFRQDFLTAFEGAEKSGECSEDEALLARWLIWMMNQKRFGELRLSTFRGYLSAISNRVIPLPDDKSLSEIDAAEWKRAIVTLAFNDDYTSSSRLTAITHMKALNEFLHVQGLAPKINFSNRDFRVYRGVAECDVMFPHEIDVLIEAVSNRPNMAVALIMAFYCGLRCEEICYLTVQGALDLYRLLIGRSKLKSSCRTLPYGLLMPQEHLTLLMEVIEDRVRSGSTYLIQHDNDEAMPTWKLSKQVCRLLESRNARVQKMHALRHAFASWQFVRYFMITDRQFRKDVRVGRFHLDLDARHSWFGQPMLADFAEVCGGSQWRWELDEYGECQAKATDMMILSKLMGHANRFTTLENYANSIGWVCRYYLRRREASFLRTPT